MKQLLLLVLLCCTFTTSAQELFKLESHSNSEFNLETELSKSEVYFNKSVVTYYETDTDSYLFISAANIRVITKVISIEESVVGLYDTYLMIESYYAPDNTYIYLMIPKINQDNYLLIFSNNLEKIAMKCHI